MSATTAIAIIACSVVAPGRRSSRNHRLPAGGIYALKPIGKSPAYFKKPDESEKTKTRNPVVNALFGAGAETKARIARLEYELETGACESKCCCSSRSHTQPLSHVSLTHTTTLSVSLSLCTNCRARTLVGAGPEAEGRRG
jgi:hypothetical protein